MKTIKLLSFPLLATFLLSCSKIQIKFDFTLNDYEEELSFHSEAQINYFNDNNYDNIDRYTGTGSVDLAKSLPIEISWDVETNYEEDYSFEFVYSKNENMEESKSILTEEKKVTLNNLEIDRTYYYQINIKSELKKDYQSEISSFKTTSLGLRNLNISSLSNFRDAGGLLRQDGTRTAQSLLYRSAALNKSYASELEVTTTAEDLALINETFAIKTEIDLRDNQTTSKGIEIGGIEKSPLGDDVTYINLPMLYGGSNILTRSENKESIKSFFDLLSKKENYPIMFHCSQGKDRTGGLSYVIGALLGVEHETLMRDYLFTNFSDVGTVKSNGIEGTAMIGGVIRNYEGETLKEKTYNYLVNKNGVPSETLDKIIDILG